LWKRFHTSPFYAMMPPLFNARRQAAHRPAVCGVHPAELIAYVLA
jgi:hypothetical protein